MDALFSSILTGVAGIFVAVITGIVSYRTARWNLRRDLEVELRKQRLNAFKELWALSEPLAKYGRTDAITRITPATVNKLASALRHWYFHQGGMFLTDASRDAYFAFQDELEVVAQEKQGSLQDTEVDEPTRLKLLKKSSALRTEIRASFKGFPSM